MKNDPHSCEHNLGNYIQINLKKIQDINGVWTHDLVILVRCSNNLRAIKPLMLGAGQLFVFICSRERDECDRCNYMKIINHKELWKWNQMKNDPCSCERTWKKKREA